MTAIADIVVKKNDGTTDITWSGDVGAAGDRIPAKYSSKSVSTTPAFQPKMTVATRGNADGSVRRVDMTLSYPFTATDTTTNVTSKLASCLFQGTWSVPQEVPSTVVDEFVSQLANLIDSATLVAVMKSQQAPT